MKIGDRVVLTKMVVMYESTYFPGHQFTIIGEDSIRGFDLEDDKGNKIYETRFITDSYISISEYRDRKVDEYLK